MSSAGRSACRSCSRAARRTAARRTSGGGSGTSARAESAVSGGPRRPARRGTGPTEKRRRRGRAGVVCIARQGGPEPELAMLRFSLGLPELEENLKLPRAIGVAAAALIVANIASDPGSAYALRSTGVGLALALACYALPWLDDRITGARAGAGGGSKRLAMVMGPAAAALRGGGGGGGGGGGTDIDTELAWASYALMRNTPVTTLLVFTDGGADDRAGGIVFRGEIPRAFADDRQGFLGRATAVAARLAGPRRAGAPWDARDAERAAGAGVAAVASERVRPRELARVDGEGLFPDRVADAVVIWCRYRGGGAGAAERTICALLLSSDEGVDDGGVEWSRCIVEKMAGALAAPAPPLLE